MDQEALDVLAQVPLFAGLTADELLVLTRQASVRTYRKNTLLMEKGDDASSLYVILSGRVKVFSADNSGKEITLNELGPRDLVGELALIDNYTRTASVMTAESCRCLVLPKASFLEFVRARPEVALRLLTVLAERVRRLTEEVERLALRDVYGRLVDTLNERALDEDGRLVTDALTQRELAALVGSSREMVSRIFKDLKAGGYIALEGKRVVILRKLPDRW